jgi:hypothetical protein
MMMVGKMQHLQAVISRQWPKTRHDEKSSVFLFFASLSLWPNRQTVFIDLHRDHACHAHT